MDTKLSSTKKLYQRWWFWVLVVFAGFYAIGIVAAILNPITTATIQEKEFVPCETITKQDHSLPLGQEDVYQECQEGEVIHEFEVKIQNDQEISRREIKTHRTVEKQDRLVRVGAKTAEPEPAPVTPTPTSTGGPTSTGVQSTSLYFDNCTEAREAGYANIPQGSPGYRAALDRDKDGVACDE